MNLDRLRRAEKDFLFQFPGGFDDPQIKAVARKHNVPRMIEFCQSSFASDRFVHTGQVVDDMVTAVSRSSMVSMFEKPKFRDFVKGLTVDDRAFLVQALRDRLHGDEQMGFEMLVDLLATGKLAKWSLVSIIPMYFRPVDEVFVKPTTAKKIVTQLEIGELQYNPRPSWAFYRVFRERINEMKAAVDPSLSPNSAAFTGFLMMSL